MCVCVCVCRVGQAENNPGAKADLAIEWVMVLVEPVVLSDWLMESDPSTCTTLSRCRFSMCCVPNLMISTPGTTFTGKKKTWKNTLSQASSVNRHHPAHNLESDKKNQTGIIWHYRTLSVQHDVLENLKSMVYGYSVGVSWEWESSLYEQRVLYSSILSP